MRSVSPKLQAWLVSFNEILRSLEQQNIPRTPSSAREGLAETTRTFVTHSPAIESVIDDLVDNIPVRIYHPRPEKLLPVIIYLHGGGHMAGSIEVYDPICKKIAHTTEHIVISVDYRLAPEHPYPAGLNDAYRVVEQIWALLDKNHIGAVKALTIAGDSGGGALCASICHRAQFDSNVSIDNQILIYPSLDYTMKQKSVQENGVGYLLEAKGMAWYFDHYFQHAEDRVIASPLYSNFTDALPRTLLVTAEFCPLRDEGKRYVSKLQQVGVEATNIHYPDMIHAFLNLEDLVQEECHTLYSSMAEFLYQP
ncbi:alpha/beta hydrolase [Vibrio sp. S4M6]|uniref:alpha/beta hydrolase n=1 Tax=Vibrio sinus TaxID=2946865 RepID=UPI00202A7AED|nr:alpha/beta hydrolase [Vibrio sinus]MCL9781651.1 alpha/beta hydrolase [Vibrio sinus]